MKSFDHFPSGRHFVYYGYVQVSVKGHCEGPGDGRSRHHQDMRRHTGALGPESGALAYAVMCLTVGLFPEKQLWVVSALAGVAHNAGQLAACVLVVKTPGVLAYAPILAASGVITGVFTGLVAMYLLRALKKTKL